MALRLNGSQSQLTGFPGLVALEEPPMSGDLILINYDFRYFLIIFKVLLQ